MRRSCVILLNIGAPPSPFGGPVEFYVWDTLLCVMRYWVTKEHKVGSAIRLFCVFRFIRMIKCKDDKIQKSNILTDPLVTGTGLNHSNYMSERSQKVFIALGAHGEAETPKDITNIDRGFSLWNLKKIPVSDFVVRIQEEIPPVNRNVLGNYLLPSSNSARTGITEGRYAECSWGLLVPQTV